MAARKQRKKQNRKNNTTQKIKNAYQKDKNNAKWRKNVNDNDILI